MFFAAFSLLEATLPSLVSKFAPRASARNGRRRVFERCSSSAHSPARAVGGVLAQHAGAAAVFGFGVLLTLGWLIASATMAAPPAYHSTYSMGET